MRILPDRDTGVVASTGDPDGIMLLSQGTSDLVSDFKDLSERGLCTGASKSYIQSTYSVPPCARGLWRAANNG